MDIKVTNVDVAFIKEIDRKAAEISKNIGRKFSRNEYIKMLIQHDCELRLIQYKQDRFDQAIGNVAVTLDRQTEQLQEFINSNNRLFHLMATGKDIEEQTDKL
ncbi:hypothetical protein QUF84_00490 [Fictibacillus enclensis]|uniref:hypothetical protein n=1 Tax=Fictibacillus enclensis TaxID=1017270 RepID=UPI0025A0D63E|nr:hypothetical protein [Fictibacillus enclensis]MDM5335774.1 hypothetical protein [Fictibacillus enclensis]